MARTPFNSITATAAGSGTQTITIPGIQYPNHAVLISGIHASSASATVLTVTYGGVTVYQIDVAAGAPLILDLSGGITSGLSGTTSGVNVVVALTGSGNNKLNVIYVLMNN